MGICGFASVDWVTADFADTYSGETHRQGSSQIVNKLFLVTRGLLLYRPSQI